MNDVSGGLELGWSSQAGDGEQLSAERLDYRISNLKGETNAEEVGADPASEEGIPFIVEPPTITGVEEGEAPYVEKEQSQKQKEERQKEERKNQKPVKLKVLHGTWAGERPITFEYQWERCDEHGESCEKIDREGHTVEIIKEKTGEREVPCNTPAGCPSEYSGQTLVTADVGHTLRATVIAENGQHEPVPKATELTLPVVQEQGEGERTTHLNRTTVNEHNPYPITHTYEKFPIGKVVTASESPPGCTITPGTHYVRECPLVPPLPLEPVAWEVKLKIRETLGEQSRVFERTMVGLPKR